MPENTAETREDGQPRFAVQRVVSRPPYHKNNAAFNGAYRKGVEARQAGQPEDANPYGDQRTHFGGVTFARAFWKAWRQGWMDAGEAG